METVAHTLPANIGLSETSKPVVAEFFSMLKISYNAELHHHHHHYHHPDLHFNDIILVARMQLFPTSQQELTVCC